MSGRLGAVLAAAALLAGCGGDGGPPSARPDSTLDATIRSPLGDGTFAAGPAEPLLDRTELAPRGTARDDGGRLALVADAHVRDEESPARVPFLDRLGPPVTEAFRPQEALSAQVLDATFRALGGERPDAVALMGDLLDGAQRNELDALLAIARGGRVDPGSGDPGYRGVQEAANPDGFFYRPDLDAPRERGLLDRAQRPFDAAGAPARLLPVLGNHDVLVQGVVAPSAATDAIATGDRALLTFDPALRDLVDRLPSDVRDAPELSRVPPSAIAPLLAGGVPGDASTVPADAARARVPVAKLVDRLRRAGDLLAPGGARMDYVADVGSRLRVIVLDTARRGGGANGELLPAQTRFLRQQLARAADRAVVVSSHHDLTRTRGAGPALDLLAADPDVVAEVHGHTHRHRIEPVRTATGGRWRIGTASLTDWPQQARMLRLVEGPGGARALETWTVDHAGTLGGGDLAGAARRLSYLDAQGGRPGGFAGDRADRNARLWLPAR